MRACKGLVAALGAVLALAMPAAAQVGGGGVTGGGSGGGGCSANCTFTGATTLASPVTITEADNTKSLIFSPATFTSNMSAVPLIDIQATENTGAGTHDYLKMAITRTAGEFNFFNFLGGASGTTRIATLDRTGSLTLGGIGPQITADGAGALLNFIGGPFYTQGSYPANTQFLDSSGTRATSNTGANATSAFNLAHTLSTSGAPSVFKLAVTDTAHAVGTKIFDLLGGTAGTTRLFSVDTSGQTIQSGVSNILFVASNFTTAANTNLQVITGLSATLPANLALNVPFTCKLLWSQATAAVVVSFGLQTDTVTPSNFIGLGQMETNLTVTSYNDVNIANTTATVVVTGTPNATGTIYNAYIDGFLENPSNASTTTLNVMVKTATAGDAVTVYRGSFCRLF